LPASLTKKVGIASLIMMASILLSRVIGLLREMAVAHLGGASSAVDAYRIAFALPDLVNHFIASGFLSVTFIPIFSHYLVQDNEKEGWRVFSMIFTTFGALLLFFIMLAFFFTPQVMLLAAPGLQDQPPEQLARVVRLTRIILPGQFFIFAGSMLMAVQFAKEQFKWPALAPLIYNAGIILGGIALHRWIGMEGFAWGVLAGAFLGNFLIQYFGAKRVGLQFHPVFDFRHPDFKKYVGLTLPLMVGLTAAFSTDFFSKFFGSYLPEGSIAALDYALRTMFVLVGVFGQASGVASFPYLSRLVAENKFREMNQLLNQTLRRYIALVIPFAVLMIVLRYEVIRLLFQRGKFDEAATARTSEVLLYLLLGAFAFAGQPVVMRGFYAMQNTLFPTIFGSIAVLVSLPFYWFSMQQMGINGVALSMAISAVLQATLLYALWNRRTANVESRAVYRFFGKIILLSLALGLLVHAFKINFLQRLDPTTFRGSLLLCSIIGVIFLLAFFAVGYVFRIREIVAAINRLIEKLGLRRLNKAQ